MSLLRYALAALLLLAPLQAHAKEGSAKTEAKQLFDEAIEQLDAGRGALGRDLLRRSLALYPTVATRYNLGVALRQTGETSEAIATFEGLLEGGSLNETLRAKTKTQLRESRAELATVIVAVTGTDRATVEIDGRELGESTPQAPLRVQVDAGERVVLARADGESRQSVQLARGEQRTVTLHVIPSVEQEQARKKQRKRRIAWITVASAVVAGTITAIAVTQTGGTEPLVPTDTGNIATLRQGN